MSDWVIVDERQGFQAIDVSDTVQNHPLGTRVKARHATYGEGEFIYCKGVASTVAGSAVLILPDTTYFDTNLLNANYIGPVGFAMSACVASNYGWYQICGIAKAITAGAASNFARVWATSTPGTIDDTTADGDLVHNAKYAGAAGGAGSCFLSIYFPYCDDIATND